MLLQLSLLGHCHGLSDEETKDLWVQADIDGNGVLDYKEFQVTFVPENHFLFSTFFWVAKVLFHRPIYLLAHIS